MNYQLRRSAPRSIKVFKNNYINNYNNNNQYDYMTANYTTSYDNNILPGYDTNTLEYLTYSPTNAEFSSNYPYDIYNVNYTNQGFSSHPQPSSAPQTHEYFPSTQQYSSQPEGYSSHPQTNFTSNEISNNNYPQYNYENYNTNKNAYQFNNNYNYNYDEYSNKGTIKYYDQYGNEIKKQEIPYNYDNYYQVQKKKESYPYPYSSNNNQNIVIQKTTNKTVNEQNQFSEEQIKKWLEEAENQNNKTNEIIKTTENQNNNIYSNKPEYGKNNNTNINTTTLNQNTKTYDNIITNENYDNYFDTNINIYPTESTSTNDINKNTNNNLLINNTNTNTKYNNYINNNNQMINNTNTNINPTENNFSIISNLPKTYYFFNKGLYNIGSTCYMNATLQCLLHVSPLVSYFKNKFPQEFASLKKLNASSPSQGNISLAFYELINSISPKLNQSSIISSSFNSSAKTSIFGRSNSLNVAVSPENFQRTLGKFNPQFRNLEANDSKDLILYLLQVMHQELNYYSKNVPFNGYPNQYNRAQTYFAFILSYEKTNYSIISDLFYGTYENVTKCANCNLIIYNFQKFEFLSFGVNRYHGKEFNILNGFDDYTKLDKLTGDNQYYCNKCKKLCDAEIQTKLIWPPKYLLINIDYGKNKMYMPSSVKFGEEIDITKYFNFDFKKRIKYRIIGVCSHLGDSGFSGHYIAFCKNMKNGKWYRFNDAMVSECTDFYEIMTCGTPYLLLYEQIN